METICSHFGSNNGYYRRGRVSGNYTAYYKSDGATGDNTHLVYYLKEDFSDGK